MAIRDWKTLVRRVRLLAYAEELRSAFPQSITGNGIPSTILQSPISNLIEPLTEPRTASPPAGRRLSNRDIADELVISVDTVKTHLRTLYGKLGAHSRMQAILRAKELNLIQ
jgi:hypothetical protein